VLEEIQMPPLLFLDVVNAAFLGSSSRASETAAPCEADLQFELFLVGVEFRPQHHPRGTEA
jgi:hypothetical protein